MMLLHFIRPWLLLGMIPPIFFMIRLWKNPIQMNAWAKVCDPHLLKALFEQQEEITKQNRPFFTLLLSLMFMAIAAAGPSFKKLPQVHYSTIPPKIILLDVSKNMLAADLLPDRIQRAKFIVQDLLNQPDITPVGMLAYTQEPYVVSPLTTDTQTIHELLPSLDTDTPPIDGLNLAYALDDAAQLIHQASFKTGSILVLTGSPPDKQALETALSMRQQGFNISILPLVQHQPFSSSFTSFAKNGGGLVLSITRSEDLKHWIRFANRTSSPWHAKQSPIPFWQDEGRWFLILAMLFLLPVFRRGWIRNLL